MSDTSKIIFERLEDGIITFEISGEKESFDYPEVFVPVEFKEGDIIIAKLHKNESGEIEFVEFLELDEEAMCAVKEEMMARSRAMRERVLRNKKKNS